MASTSAWQRGVALAERARALATKGSYAESHTLFVAAIEECMRGNKQTFDRMTRKRQEVELRTMLSEAEKIHAKKDQTFFPAKSCDGPRPGFMFRMGSKGLGWYVDTYGRRAASSGNMERMRKKNASANYASARKIATSAVGYDKERDFKNAYECYKKCVDYYHLACADAATPERRKQIESELKPYKRRAEELGTFLKKATYWSYTGEGPTRSDKTSSRYDDAIQHAKDAVEADNEGRYDDAVASYSCACEDFIVALKFKIVPNPAREAVKDRIRGYMARAEALKKIVDANPSRFGNSPSRSNDEGLSKDPERRSKAPIPRFLGSDDADEDGNGDDDITLESLESRFKDLKS